MRYYWSKKATVEESLDLSVYDLKRRGMLTGHAAVEITWVNSRSGEENTVSVIVDITDDPIVTLIYSLTDRESNKADYKLEVSLVTTPCSYGGVRYWFGCPSCGRRVAVLYLAPGDVYFRCRHCNDLSYHSRSRCGIALFGHTWRQIEKLQGEIKRWTWRGRPTRKVKRLNALKQKVAVLGSHEQARMEKFRTRLR